MAQPTSSEIDTFKGAFTGAVLTPGDADYDPARGVWNGEIDKRPALIARCTSSEQVAAAIGFGREQGIDISVRGGGHNFGGFAVAQDGLMIDLSRMKQISVDPAERTASCGGGTTWAELDAATQEHGLAVVGGTISHTGVGGLTLGGGMGWLTGKLGLSIDNLLSCEVVTADGRVLHASETEHPDLFWALRGGGGNFGVVTSFEFRLAEVGPLVNLGFFFWGADKGVAALRFCRDFVKELPEDMGVLLAGLNAPPAPFVPEQFRFLPGYALLVAGFGSPEEHEQAVRPVLEAGSPLFHMITPIPYAQLQQMLDESAPWGILGYEKALYLDDLSDDVVDVVADYFPRKTSPQSFVPVFPLRGAYARVDEDGTAFGGHRDAGIAFNITALSDDPDVVKTDRAWVRAFWEALLPFSSTSSGSYVNFMTEYDENRVRHSYGAAKYDRLARIKAEYDPSNVFHLNANIKPALQPV